MPNLIEADVTQLLAELAAGNPEVKDELFDCVYRELHMRARKLMAHEWAERSWGATDLVHELCLRFFRQDLPPMNRDAFFGRATKVMRWLLLDRARQRKRKRLDKQIPLDAVLDQLEATHEFAFEDLHEALQELEAIAPQEHEVAMLRIFSALNSQEIGAMLGVSERTVQLDWKWARAWLYGRLKGANHAS